MHFASELRAGRLTNAFRKKMENHEYAMLLHLIHHNVVRIHKTLRTTQAMAAGVTKKLWEMSDVVEMMERWEAIEARAKK